jgi:hypothetical protein
VKTSQKNTHILQSNRLNLRVEIRPLQDLIPSHTLILHDFARLAAKDSDLGAVTLEHEGAEHGASGGAVAVAHYELMGVECKFYFHYVLEQAYNLPMATLLLAIEYEINELY